MSSIRMQDHTITVTILIPAYNEERTVVELLQRVNAQHVEGVTLEILVVDDGSSDGTLAQLEKHAQLYSRLIKRAQNGGKGAAVRDGLLAATGEYVLFQDADLEYDPADYKVLFAPMLSRNADVVVGSRLVGSPITRVHYFWHRVGNQALTLLFNLTNNTTFTDIYSCYILFRRSLIDAQALGSSGWEQQAELLSKLARSATTMFEVPISYYGRTYEEGKKIRPIHALSVARTILRERLTTLGVTRRECRDVSR